MQIIKMLMLALVPIMAHAQIYCASPISVAIKNKYCPDVDYIVLGLGTGGSVVAKILTDDFKTSVLALEQGENLTADPIIKFTDFVLLTVLSSLVGPPLYQNGLTTEQPFANDRMLLWVRALLLGGASSVNAGAYNRGTNVVFDQWGALAGPLWAADRIQCLYKELENYHLPFQSTPNPELRGNSGPLSIRQVQNPGAVSQTFTQAIANATGLPIVIDPNDPLPQYATGPTSQVQYYQSFPDGELRVSGATAFLNNTVMTPEGQGVGGRKLQALFKSTALRVLWQGNKAIGVEYQQNGITRQAFARKGVIACTGLQNSPLLMHSGVGDPAILQPLGIPVVVNNPNVGKNFADHFIFITLWTSDPDDTPVPDTIHSIFKSIAWLPSPPPADQGVRKISFTSVNQVPGLTVGLYTFCQPESTGRIVINSNDPLAPAVIDSGVLSNPNDLTTLVNLFQVTLKNINTQIQVINPLYKLIYPDPSILEVANQADLIEFIKNNIISSEHFQSHCRMAPLDQGGVVDSTGLVYGTQNLYLADDSIVPQNMDGSPMSTALLIGYNIAQILTGNTSICS